jgi:hypothetical protein
MSHFTSKHSLRSVWTLYHLVTFGLKWGDGWAPQTFCWGIFVLPAPLTLPPYCIDLSLSWKALIQPSETFTPKHCWKKIRCPAAAVICIRDIISLILTFEFTLHKIFKWHGACVSGRVSSFLILLFGHLDFYRSLCYVVCVHGLV